MKTNLLDNILKILVVGILIAVAVSYYSMKSELNSFKKDIITNRIDENLSYQKQLDSLFTLKMNTRTFYSQKIIEREKQRDENQNQISNTNDLDSLIKLYFKYRANTTN